MKSYCFDDAEDCFKYSCALLASVAIVDLTNDNRFSVVGLAALVAVAVASIGASCHVQGGGTTTPVTTDFGYTVELPDRCSVLVGLSRASETSTDFAYCINPEGNFARFDRGVEGTDYNIWAEVDFVCNSIPLPTKAEISPEVAILKYCAKQ